MAETNEAKVNTPCGAYNAMASQWSLIDDLLGGASAMKAKATEYLPKFPKEDAGHYNARIANSTLFNAYGDTVGTIIGKPFSKPLDMKGDLPEPLDQIAEDVDGAGKELMQLAKDVFSDYINRGLGHILVDYPKTINDEGRSPNRRQEREAGYRPRFVHIRPDQLIGWQTMKDITGKPYLSRIRIRETQVEPDGQWGEKIVKYIRVIEPDIWQLYKETDQDEYTLLEEGINSLGKVPLVTGYSNMTGFLMAEPPLRDLAETNLAHFQSDSDQANILHYARAATLFVKGFNQDEADKIALGPNQLISTTNEQADAKYVEVNGNAIEAGQKHIDKLEQRMTILGLQPYMRTIANQTATGQGIDESRANSDIQAWVMSLEDLFYRAYKTAAEWIGVELPEDFKINIFNDFAIWLLANQQIDELIKIRQTGEITRKTFLEEIRRRALLSETIDINEEIAGIEAEGPSLASLGLGG
jgi:hypothetical protein